MDDCLVDVGKTAIIVKMLVYYIIKNPALLQINAHNYNLIVTIPKKFYMEQMSTIC